MDDLACPKCKTTKYRNPSLKLMVNVCGHALCENCVELLFVKGSGSCPECQIPLRRNNFRLQLFEDAVVEKDVDIRKRVIRVFNKREEDFNTLREYNDYLEEVENCIYNLTNNIDVEATQRKIENYKKDNKVIIQKNSNKLSRDEEHLAGLIEHEQIVDVMRKKSILHEEMEEKKCKVKNKEALLDELMFSDAPVEEILANYAGMIKKSATAIAQSATKLQIPKQQFSTGIKFTQDAFIPLPKVEEMQLYNYEEPQHDLLGPSVPYMDELSKGGFLTHVRPASELERAGGFLADIACHRALQEAMCGLYYNAES